MPGDERTRFCDKCNEHVYDLSERTEDEARALYRDRGVQKLCVRYAKDERGAILFKAAAMAAVLSAAGCSAAVPEPHAEPPVQVDRDFGDGVLDQTDRCPDEPTGEDDGCPDPETKPVTPDAGHD